MIIRNVDVLGRIVIPKEMRKELNIEPGNPVEIELNGKDLKVRKHEERCIFCGKKAVHTYRNKKICNSCKEGLKNE